MRLRNPLKISHKKFSQSKNQYYFLVLVCFKLHFAGRDDIYDNFPEFIFSTSWKNCFVFAVYFNLKDQIFSLLVRVWLELGHEWNLRKKDDKIETIIILFSSFKNLNSQGKLYTKRLQCNLFCWIFALIFCVVYLLVPLLEACYKLSLFDFCRFFQKISNSHRKM